MQIGIIGNGFVGRSIAEVWKPSHEVRIHDRQQEKSPHSLLDVMECDLVFVCLPTPSNKDGSCDVTALDSFFAFASRKPQYAIKSTVPVGYTASVRADLDVCHNPEFLTARTCIIDALTPHRQLIGKRIGGIGHILLREMYEKRFPGVPIIEVNPNVRRWQSWCAIRSSLSK